MNRLTRRGCPFQVSITATQSATLGCNVKGMIQMSLMVMGRDTQTVHHEDFGGQLFETFGTLWRILDQNGVTLRAEFEDLSP